VPSALDTDLGPPKSKDSGLIIRVFQNNLNHATTVLQHYRCRHNSSKALKILEHLCLWMQSTLLGSNASSDTLIFCSLIKMPILHCNHVFWIVIQAYCTHCYSRSVSVICLGLASFNPILSLSYQYYDVMYLIQIQTSHSSKLTFSSCVNYM